MKKYLFVLTVLFISNFNSFAQKYELGQVTIEELKEKIHPKYSSAVAAILFKKVETTFNYNLKNGFYSITEFTIKIKIYKKEGLKWADFEIPYYVGYKTIDNEMVSIKKAFTYNVENEKIIKQNVSSEGKFKEKTNEYWESKLITFPNVKEGSIIELKYELNSQNLSVLPVFQYQYTIPVGYAQYITEIPGIYLYKAIKSGYVDVVQIDKIESASRQYEDEYKITNYLNYQQIKSIYEVANVPALIEENYVSNVKDIFAKIENELEVIQYPNQKPKEIANSWESVAKSIYEEKEFGAELNKTSYYFTNLQTILDKIDSKEERMKIIFEFVKGKMSWNGMYGYYTKNGVEKAYQDNSGNVAEINLILISMLKTGGLEANPVLLSTRGNGVAAFPNRSKLNYVIAAVTLDGKQILLDATDKLCTISCLPIRALNDKGRLINKDGSSNEIDLMPKSNSKDITNLNVNIDNNGQVTGKVREQYFDYNAFSFREKYSALSKETYLERLEKKLNNIEIGEYEVLNSKDLSKPIVETYSFKKNSMVEVIGDKMYFSPLLFFTATENPFKQEIREYPVDFVFPNQEKYLINITIPEGYVIESMPAPISIAMRDNLGSFRFNISNNDRQIQLVVTQNINSAIFYAEYYDELKAFFSEIIKKETEKIILKKA